MFGYIKPAYGELKVKENELYRAAYCGLCRSMGRCTGCISRMTLSYDFVFLALVRYVLSGETVGVDSGRCAAHPVKPRPYLKPSGALDFSAGAAAVLFCEKNEDDIKDERGIRRFISQLLRLPAKSASARAGMEPLRSETERGLSVLSILEGEGCPEIDSAADAFGSVLAGVVSYGLDGASARIASEIGRYTGRIIYICDAADDVGDDLRLGRYNPFICAYGDDCSEERVVYYHGGHSKRKIVLKRDIAEGIYTAVMLDLRRLGNAEALLDYERAPMLRGIIQNIIGIGIPGEAMRVLGLVPSTLSALSTLS